MRCVLFSESGPYASFGLKDGVVVPEDDWARGMQIEEMVIVMPGEGRVYPEDGERFLLAIPFTFRNTGYSWADILDDEGTVITKQVLSPSGPLPRSEWPESVR